jgi:DNA-binding transcriptional LysR family regulator
MEFRDLRYLEVLAAELHFGRAASRLHMTQPALSQALARMEREIGCPLLLRDSRGASLTSAGRALLNGSRGVLKSLELACELARRAGRGDAGNVTIGFVDAAVFQILPRLLRGARERYPAINVVSRQFKSVELAAAMDAGQLDLGILRRDSIGPDVETRTLLAERMSLVVPQDHRLADARDVTVAELVDEDFIVPALEGVPVLYSLCMDTCAAAGFTPHVVAHIVSIQVLIELVAQGIGVAFAPASWAGSRSDVAVKRLRQVEEHFDITIAYRPKQLSTAAQHLLELALEQALPDARTA